MLWPGSTPRAQPFATHRTASHKSHNAGSRPGSLTGSSADGPACGSRHWRPRPSRDFAVETDPSHAAASQRYARNSVRGVAQELRFWHEPFRRPEPVLVCRNERYFAVTNMLRRELAAFKPDGVLRFEFVAPTPGYCSSPVASQGPRAVRSPLIVLPSCVNFRRKGPSGLATNSSSPFSGSMKNRLVAKGLSSAVP